MDFEWLYPVACPACAVCPKVIADYDRLGYPICPRCGTTVRAATVDAGTGVAAPRTE
ncbi:hypothetical protein HKK80_10110 [Halonotius sp. F2-221B]|uniref:hypothetical protein n=1 Tax=Halonotius sp. F2-221B TaxID=2731620 RepID=UPI00398B3492